METYYEISNPTTEDISIVFKGDKYTVLAKDSIKNVPEEVMYFWTATHQFLGKTKMAKAKVDAIVTEATPEVEEVAVEAEEVEEAVEEVVGEEVKGKKK